MFAIYPQWNFLKTIVFIALFLPVLGWAQVPTNGLVAYYPFNGNANDESGNGNNPTTNTATLTSDRFGNVNKAYSFTSTNTFLSVNPRATMPMNTFDAFHFSTWIKPIELGAGSRIAVFVDASNNSHEIVFDHNTRKILFFSWRGSYQMQLFSTTTISLNEWTQLSINVDYNTSTTNLYINGALNATSNAQISRLTANPSIYVGKHHQFSPDGFLKGSIDDIRIYNRALSDAEVTRLYTAEAPPVTLQTGLVAYYPFNGNANDESGNNNHGTVVGATLSDDKKGLANSKSYQFNGTSNYIRLVAC